MWFPRLDALSPSSSGNSFLLCRWDEFFDDFTPDSYQPRLCHLPTLIDEIAMVATEAQKQSGWKKHLNHLLEELRARLKQEVFFGICEDTDLRALTELMRETDLIALTGKARQFQFSHFKDKYERAAIARGRTELEKALAGEAKQKKVALHWLGLWATIGLRKDYLYSNARMEKDERLFSSSLQANIDSIAEALVAPPGKYLCVLAILPIRSHDDDPPIDGQIPVYTQRVQAVVRKAGIGFASHEWFPGRSINSQELLLTMEETGVGPMDALHRFVRKLQPVLNLLGFYRGAPPTEIIHRGWAGPDRANLIEHEIKPLLPRLRPPRKKAVDLSVHTLGVWQSGRLDGPLVNALELHSLAVSSEDLRVQFVTMWSALESLAASVDGPTIISRVTNLLTPIISWRRLETEIRYLAISLHQWRDATDAKSTKIDGLPYAREHSVPAEDVLLAVTRPKNHRDIVSILEHVSPHPLLCWRTFSTWDNFHDPRALSADMTASRQRLTWHLWRIYRARNLLVHAGLETPLLSHLLSHLGFYLTTAISRLLHQVTHNVTLDARNAADYWCDLGNRIPNLLSSSSETVRVKDVMTSPHPKRANVLPWGRLE